MGTALGIVALLQSMGGPDAKDRIGPAMAVALVTTIYGLAISNFILIPIAENLTKQTQEDLICRKIVIEGILLINEDKSPRYIEEKVKSFLLPNQRAKVGNFSGPASSRFDKAA